MSAQARAIFIANSARSCARVRVCACARVRVCVCVCMCVCARACVHRVTPLLYVTFWFISVRGKTMNLAHTLPILLFPVAYLIYWLVRCPLVGSYPYFFIDVASYGYAQVLINSVLLWFGFWLVALAYWAINKFTTPIYV